jgi:hypothetical protein
MVQLISLQEMLLLTMRVDGTFADGAGFSDALDWQMLRLH